MWINMLWDWEVLWLQHSGWKIPGKGQISFKEKKSWNCNDQKIKTFVKGERQIKDSETFF